MLRDLVDEDPAIPHRPWVGQGGGSAPGGATFGPAPREAWVRRDWLHVLVREPEAVLGSARLSGACSRRARLHNKALKLARSASRVRGHSACTSRPRPGMLLAQLKAKDVRKPLGGSLGIVGLGLSHSAAEQALRSVTTSAGAFPTIPRVVPDRAGSVPVRRRSPVPSAVGAVQ